VFSIRRRQRHGQGTSARRLDGNARPGERQPHAGRHGGVEQRAQGAQRLLVADELAAGRSPSCHLSPRAP